MNKNPKDADIMANISFFVVVFWFFYFVILVLLLFFKTGFAV